MSGVVWTWGRISGHYELFSIVLVEATKRLQISMVESPYENKGFVKVTFESPSKVLYFPMKY